MYNILNNILNNIKNIYNNIKININKKHENNIIEGFNNEYVLTKEQSYFIYYTSYLLLFTSFIKFYSNPLISLQTFLIHLTSITYWRNAKHYIYTRYLDILSVIGLIMGNLFYCIYNNYNYFYILLQSIAVLMYPLSYYYYNKNYYWLSTYIHTLVHIISNIAIWFLIY